MSKIIVVGKNKSKKEVKVRDFSIDNLFKKANLAPEKTTIISFSYDVVLAVKKKFPRRMVHYLSSLKKDKISGELRPSVESLVQRAIDAKLDGVSIGNMGFDGAAENDQLSHYLKKLRNYQLI